MRRLCPHGIRLFRRTRREQVQISAAREGLGRLSGGYREGLGRPVTPGSGGVCALVNSVHGLSSPLPKPRTCRT